MRLSAVRLKAALEMDERVAATRPMRILLVTLVAIGTAVLLTEGRFAPGSTAQRVLEWVIDAAVLLFLVEYLLRLWLAGYGERSPARARLAYATSFSGIVDLLSAVPVAAFVLAGLDGEALLAVLWPLKLFRLTPSMWLVGRVFERQRDALLGVLVTLVVGLMLSGTAIHLIEGRVQPEAFGTVAGGVWWAVVSLTSTGYGDAVPVTDAGRILAGFVMVGGLAVVAMLTGVLVTGFATEIRRRDFLRTWNLVARVPLFARLPPAVIADVAEILRPRSFRRGETIYQRGDEADGMWFVVEGAVLLDHDPPLHVQAGDFFGETALLERICYPTSAVALRRSTLLQLDVAEFHQLAARSAELGKLISAEHAERMALFGPTLDRDGDGRPG